MGYPIVVDGDKLLVVNGAVTTNDKCCCCCYFEHCDTGGFIEFICQTDNPPFVVGKVYVLDGQCYIYIGMERCIGTPSPYTEIVGPYDTCNACAPKCCGFSTCDDGPTSPNITKFHCISTTPLQQGFIYRLPPDYDCWYYRGEFICDGLEETVDQISGPYVTCDICVDCCPDGDIITCESEEWASYLPIADFKVKRDPEAETSDTQCCFQFIDTSVARQPPGCPDGEIVGWLWDFDGLGSSTDRDPTFCFDLTDTTGNVKFTVTLTVTDACGCTDTYEDEVMCSPAICCSCGPGELPDDIEVIFHNIDFNSCVGIPDGFKQKIDRLEDCIWYGEATFNSADVCNDCWGGGASHFDITIKTTIKLGNVDLQNPSECKFCIESTLVATDPANRGLGTRVYGCQNKFNCVDMWFGSLCPYTNPELFEWSQAQKDEMNVNYPLTCPISGKTYKMPVTYDCTPACGRAACKPALETCWDYSTGNPDCTDYSSYLYVELKT